MMGEYIAGLLIGFIIGGLLTAHYIYKSLDKIENDLQAKLDELDKDG